MSVQKSHEHFIIKLLPEIQNNGRILTELVFLPAYIKQTVNILSPDLYHSLELHDVPFVTL